MVFSKEKLLQVMRERTTIRELLADDHKNDELIGQLAELNLVIKSFCDSHHIDENSLDAMTK